MLLKDTTAGVDAWEPELRSLYTLYHPDATLLSDVTALVRETLSRKFHSLEESGVLVAGSLEHRHMTRVIL